jgi:hypothetical protein
MRSTAYQSKPSTHFHDLKSKLLSTRFYLLARTGPTVFTIQGEQDQSDSSGSRSNGESENREEGREQGGNESDTTNRVDAESAAESVRAQVTASRSSASNSSSSSGRTRSATLTFRCALGDPHSCTCGIAASTTGGICIHILFCLIKVLRLPENCPLCWQMGLSDAEITQV